MADQYQNKNAFNSYGGNMNNQDNRKPPVRPKDPYNFNQVQEKPPPTSMNDNFQVRASAMKSGYQERLKTGMKSNAAAGFKSKVPDGSAKIQTSVLQQKIKTEEDTFRELEKETNRLLEASVEAKLSGKLTKALELAKEAATKEKQIRRTREQTAAIEQINSELTFSVCVNLANMYQINNLLKEALNTYTIIVKNKNYPNSGRLRVNMGNIYFSQQHYPLAIKMYRMALDTVPSVNKDMRIKILKNIGHAFVKLGEFQDGIDAYENIMESQADFQTGFNLIVCYYALGDPEKMKKWFAKMLTLDIPGMEEDEEIILDKPEETGLKNDPLKEYEKSEKEKALKYISNSAKLLIQVIDQDPIAAYDWVIEALKAAELSDIESEMEIAKAIYFIKIKEFERAIDIFKGFEKKDKSMRARAANNISFLYFLEKDIENSEKYANLANETDRYNAKALVNKGNCLYVKEEYEAAKEHYLESIGVEANCIEAIYNLGLVNKRMGLFEESIQAFEKLQSIMPRNPEVIYQLGNIYEILNQNKQAIKWYNILATRIPSDAAILLKIGTLYYKEQDEIQALHFHQESYRYLPSNIDTISWLGIYYAKCDLYEKALQFFERASQIQTKEVKWKLMVATCYRKMNSFQQALKLYQEINTEYPENMECLRYLVLICKDLGINYEQYSIQLKKLERAQEAKAAIQGAEFPVEANEMNESPQKIQFYKRNPDAPEIAEANFQKAPHSPSKKVQKIEQNVEEKDEVDELLP